MPAKLKIFAIVGTLFLFFSSPISAEGPLRKSVTNPRYFTDNSGKAILLTGVHTWRNFQAIGSDNFDFQGYLQYLTQKNLNFMRLWIWEQSKGTAGFPSNLDVSPLPFARPGPGTASDGRPKFDLTQFNQTFFDRMRQHFIDAGNKGIYVDIQLFLGWSVGVKNGGDNPWPNHPFNVKNNINGINGDANGDGNGYEVNTLANSSIVAIQEAYIKKVIDTVNDLDNVLYEIAAETEVGSSYTAWQNHMIDYIHDYEATLPKQHPVGFTSEYGVNGGVVYGNNNDLFNSHADWISPNQFDSSGYDYESNPRPNDGSKVIISDTDHLWGLGGDRYWAWKSFTRGLNFSYMDCYAVSGSLEQQLGCPIPFNDPERTSLVANMGYALSYAQKMDLISMTPQGNLSSTGYVLAKAGSEYLVYQPNSGSFTVNLAAGNYNYEWFNPSTGTIVQTGTTTSTGGNKSFTPPFSGDAVLYLKNASQTTPTPIPTSSPSPTASPVCHFGDITCDGRVDIVDLRQAFTALSGIFPLTPILDNFNRANGGPPLSVNWDIVQYGHKISNQKAIGVYSEKDNLSAWKALFNTPVEAYLTISSNPDESVFSFYILHDYSQIANEDGYECWFDTMVDKLHIVRVDNQVEAQLGNLIDIGNIKIGDSVGCRVDNGIIQAWWKPSGGSWQLLGERRDLTYQGPYYIIPETWSLGIFDDFGGGQAQ